ncbi:site-specific integrase [Sphingomonas japonica]|uniref:Integrase/recombinase XerD n=2 Tax=Sphingomonas japonica TaxID=511662 RepID=A0ABX0U2I7_9SPHN|nr:site-specific integrase [Sphingomonas japonica]NIJ24788.1 integrase/recombinase XerD [Sphingomonas japonica]
MGAGKGSGKRQPSNLYQRDGVFYARITVNGREQRKSLKTTSRREAERRLKAFLAERSPYFGTTRHTFAEALQLWMDAGQWKPKTRVGYAKLLNSAGGIIEHFGSLYWDEVDRGELSRFIQQRRERKSGVATINRYLSVLSSISNHVKDLEGWPDINAVSLLPKKARKEFRLRYVRPPFGDIEAFFSRAPGTFGDLARVALLTGARKDELVQLRWDQVRDGRISFTDTKNRTPRTVQLLPLARLLVEKQPRLPGSQYVFNTRNGGPYKRATEMWREIVIRAQSMAQRDGRTITAMTFHDLRHEYAIRYLESGGSIYILQKALGHGSIRQTEQYLDYLTPETQEAAKRGSAQI